jgi:hypothetical protein
VYFRESTRMGLKTLPAAVFVSVVTASLAFAQPQQARVMGSVTDGSGGALPGVTVTISNPSTRSISVVTDSSGRYLTAWLPPGTYNLVFALSGFESRTVSGVRLEADQTAVLDLQLSLAPVSETVEVVAPAPPKPPAAVRFPAPPREPKPAIKPVDPEIIGSVCGPRQPPEFSLAIGKIVGHRDTDRQLLGPGDPLRIDAGEKQGVTKGQNLVVRRRFDIGDPHAPMKLREFGEQTAALVQVVEIHADSSVALIVKACTEIMAGDKVEPYAAQPAFFAVTAGAPNYDEPAKIIIGDHGRTAGAAGQMMVIDQGLVQGVQRGQRLTIFRHSPVDATLTVPIGDGVIVAIRADSATILIERATDAAHVGDLVALHR